MMERFSSLVTKSRPWPVIGRTIFFTSDKNRPTRDEIYFIDFWRENLSMYRIMFLSSFPTSPGKSEASTLLAGLFMQGAILFSLTNTYLSMNIMRQYYSL